MRLLTTALTGVLLAGSVVSAPSSAPAEASSWCSGDMPGVTTYVWDGGAGTDQWIDDANWVGDHAPGFNDSDGPVRVCLAQGDDVVLVSNDDAPHQEATVDVLDLQAGARLTVTTTGRLYIQESSYLRRSSTAAADLVLSGLLSGRGDLQVDGTLHWVRTSGGASTITTRACKMAEPRCTGVDAQPGTVAVGPLGRLSITGTGGVALGDGRSISSAGRVTIGAGAYLAADNGTAIDIQAGSVLRLDDDGSIYQGFLDGPEQATLALDGTVRKSQGGTALLDAAVTVGTEARSIVRKGWLSVGGARVPDGHVRPGAALGTGGCAGSFDPCRAPVATPGDPGTLVVRLPDNHGPTADVAVIEQPDHATAEDLVPPVDIHVDGEQVSALRPMTFTFRVDADAIGARSAGSVDVLRKPSGHRQRVVPDCRADGRPPTGWRACVASRRSIDDGDVVVRVRSQVTSRWKIR